MNFYFSVEVTAINEDFKAKITFLGRIFCGLYDTILVNDASVDPTPFTIPVIS